ncbi:MAG: hypothetical protein ACYTG1_12615 [Planctomycetota bacterium]|jgi:hypothetical protein
MKRLLFAAALIGAVLVLGGSAAELDDIVHFKGTCAGIFVPYEAFEGEAIGTMTALESGRYEWVVLPTGLTCLAGKSTIVTEHGTLHVTDHVNIVPTDVPGIEEWRGMHWILSGTGAYKDVTGWRWSNGLVDVSGGRLVFSFHGTLCDE